MTVFGALDGDEKMRRRSGLFRPEQWRKLTNNSGVGFLQVSSVNGVSRTYSTHFYIQYYFANFVFFFPAALLTSLKKNDSYVLLLLRPAPHRKQRQPLPITLGDAIHYRRRIGCDHTRYRQSWTNQGCRQLHPLTKMKAASPSARGCVHMS